MHSFQTDTIQMKVEASVSGFRVKETVKETRTENERKSRQPDTYWSWIVCVVGVVSLIIVLGCSYCFGIIFPFLLDEFNEGKSNTGEYIGSAFMSTFPLIHID